MLDHSTPELQLLQRVRDEAHRFAITHHRGRRDKAMTSSLLDELPGVGPARKRALLAHFGSPDAVVAASREELQAVPGLPAKVARELHGHSPSGWPERRPIRGGYNGGTMPLTGTMAAIESESKSLKDFVVITGFSGAGKSTAMNVFEDAGYFCVDNLPPEMIRSLVELFMHEGSKVERAAVVSDVRGGVYFETLRAVVDDWTCSA